MIPWDEVVLDEGTGIVHIAPGAGAEDFDLSRVHGLDVLVPIDESGRMLPGFGPAEGLASDEAADVIIEDLRRRELLVDSGVITHRYPTCWRCGTPLVFRVVDDWFIACDEIRQPMLDANATVQWTPDFYSKRMDDWLRNMGDWNISRKRYFGLPLPFYPCDCGELNVVGSRDELVERATAGVDQLQELHRPWIDEVPIACAACGKDVHRIPEVGDAWLDAGIVPFSTLGWNNPEWIEHGYATGAAEGLSGADLPGPRLLGAVVPGGLDLGDAGADPALVLLDLVHVDDARGQVAVQGRPHVREAPRRARARDAPLLGQRHRLRRGARLDGRGRHALAVLRGRTRARTSSSATGLHARSSAGC